MSAISLTNRGAGRYAALLLALLTLAALTVLPGAVPAAQAAGVTITKDITRQHVNADGTAGAVESKSFKVSIEQTADLQPRQRIEVSWTGAKPSQGYFAGTPAYTAYNDIEYPVVLLQCRGVDTSSSQINPRTCFTTNTLSRYSEAFTFGLPDPFDDASWLIDRYASTADRDLTPTVPAGCNDFTSIAFVHFLPFIDAKGKSWAMCPPDGTQQVNPPESGDDTPLPANDQFLYSDAQGNGRTLFEVRSKAENASLGCSDTVKCSLVVVPVMGISCDLSMTTSQLIRDFCVSNGNYPVGPRDLSGGPDFAKAVSGEYWWSASIWRNRVSVPLNFAPSVDFCNVVDNRSPVDLYGSELLGEAMLQWTPAFCLDPKRFKLRHQRVGEPRAKRMLDSGQAVAALVSRPPAEDPAKPTVYAPAAISGFAIGYVWDKAPETPGGPSPGELTDLKLTPRLLAKLVTQSYSGVYGRGVHPTVGNNPGSLSQDPEFQALNPKAGVFGDEAASALVSISADSDVIAELTRYIDSDPAARAWLDGAPDEWGTRVNPKFRGIQLPIETLPLLDDWPLPSTLDQLITCGDTTTPYLNQLANPPATLAAAGTNVLDAQPTALRRCTTDINTGRRELKPLSRGIMGSRHVIGLMSLPDVEKYRVRAAALQSRPGSFVSPDVGTLRTAMRFTTVDKKTGTLPVNHALMRSNEAGKFAYPGTMVIYTSAATAGMKAADAKHVADFMRFTVGEGQQVGEGNGQLPQGYLPITRESGLGSLIDRTLELANAVEKQTEEEPPPPDDLGPDDQVPTGSGNGVVPGFGNNNPGSSSNLPGSNNGSNLPGSNTPTTAPTSGVNPSASPSPTDDSGRKQAEQALTNASTRGERSWLAQWALPLLLLIGLLGGVGAPVVVAAARPGHPVRRALANIWELRRRLRPSPRRD